MFLGGPTDHMSASIHTMTWRQAVVWTNDGMFTDAYIIHLAFESNQARTQRHILQQKNYKWSQFRSYGPQHCENGIHSV